jgi:beta-galactosidase
MNSADWIPVHGEEGVETMIFDCHRPLPWQFLRMERETRDTGTQDLFFIGGQPVWQAPELFRLNKLPARATFDHFVEPGHARTDAREQSPWFLPLNGLWDFHWAPTPEEASDFLKKHFASFQTEWDEVEVPGSWQMQGLEKPGRGWDKPHYTNVQMPFPLQPIEVPRENPTGIYRRTLTVPESWVGQRVVVHFGGADNTLLVYLDGRPVGLSKDSRSPAEFDLTLLVQPGRAQELIAVVIKWSDSTYIEDQDHWWLSGLHREVYLYATPATYLADIQAEATLEPDLKTGHLKVRVRVGGEIPEGSQTGVMLYEGDKPVWNKPLRHTLVTQRGTPMPPHRRESIHEATLKKVRPWSAETPFLYRLVVSLLLPDGTCDSTAIDIGFKRVEIKDRQLLINGKAVLIKGVNRHDHHDTRGKALTRADMELDVRMMKQFNFNAVRTSHYPNDPYFLELCDRHGLYVVDEANIEAHAFMQECASDPRYRGAFLDRISTMVLRDKNHACIYAWSLGNESLYGPNHDAAAGWVRSYDPTRPLHYEGALWRGWERKNSGATDFVCPMYASIDQIVKWARDPKFKNDPRPLILCEYSHAMGNSNGCLADYFEAFEKFHGLQGGFIWEWIDHGIIQTGPDGRPFWAYGGDFGDKPNDFNFVCDGMVWPDRTPHPAMFEFKTLAQPIKVEWANDRSGRIRVFNKRDFTLLDDLRGTWQVVQEGRVLQQGTLPELTVAPGKFQDVVLPLKPVPAGETFLNLEFKTLRAAWWAGAGHSVARSQLVLPAVKKKAPLRPVNAAPWLLVQDGGFVHASSGDWLARFNLVEGIWEGWSLGEHDLLVSGPRPQLWRAPTDNDGIKLEYDNGMLNESNRSKPYIRWLDLGLDRSETILVKARLLPGKVPALEWIHATFAQGKKRLVTTTHHRFLPGGRIAVGHRFQLDKSLADVPRVGVRLVLPQGFEHVHWSGRGPWENYPDRKASALVGVYDNTVLGEYVPYIMPQEHGLKCDVRWLELAHFSGTTIRFTADSLFHFSASHYTAEDLTRARHTHDLKARAETYVVLDAAHRGVGTHSCGPDTLDKYKITGREYRLDYTLTVRSE